ncbi:MAG: hypothetical protein ACHP7H_02540 [Hyphomicrobiales bacterium]
MPPPRTWRLWWPSEAAPGAVTAPSIDSLVRGWLAELKVMRRSEQTIQWYRQKMDWYLDHGGPAPWTA